MDHRQRIIVIGAGITGLTCAYYLRQWDPPVLVLEASERAGGLISTIGRNGFLFESGPQSPRFTERLLRMISDLGLDGEFVRGDPDSNRYIVKKGQLYRAPFSAGTLLTTGVIGLKSKLRILSEPFGFSRTPDPEETVADFIHRKFGQEVLDYLVDPIVSTVFFGDARMMGMESAFPALVRWERESGSLARGAFAARKRGKNNALTGDSSSSGSRFSVTGNLPAMGSFRRGMGSFMKSLSKRLGENIRFGTKIESVSAARVSGKSELGWKVRVEGGEEIFAEHLVVSVPAYEAARLLEAAAPPLSSLLRAISYSPMAVVSSAYHCNALRHKLDGFGFMVPSREGLNTICSIWNSSLFAGRAPEGMQLLTSYARTEITGGLLSMPDDALARTVQGEAEKILGIAGEPVERQVWKYTRALPQYNLGHAEKIKAIRGALVALPNLHLAGNYLSGRSIGDCAEVGFLAAESVRSGFQH
ncbi:MAG: protoporphyrinogen oxidase [Candidatus Acidiferrales bacterium]